MRQYQLTLTLLAAATLVACGGGATNTGTTTAEASVSESLADPRAFASAVPSSYGSKLAKVSSQVTFGDSLSDVGTYAVGTVAALGGGKATNPNSALVNSDRSQARRRRSSVALPSASSAASSNLPRDSCA